VVYGVKVVHKRHAQDLAQYLVASCFLWAKFLCARQSWHV